MQSKIERHGKRKVIALQLTISEQPVIGSKTNTEGETEYFIIIGDIWITLDWAAASKIKTALNSYIK